MGRPRVPRTGQCRARRRRGQQRARLRYRVQRIARGGPDRTPAAAAGRPARTLGHHRRHLQRARPGRPCTTRTHDRRGRRHRRPGPVRLPEAVEAIRRSGGAAVAVPDSAIRAAVRKLAARGLYAEPTSCVAVAALDHFLAEGRIAADETTVVVLTGSGLKSSEQMARAFDRSR
ncbi:pyridoxal-phosphate dependent enzyme [Nocardia brasiliensis]